MLLRSLLYKLGRPTQLPMSKEEEQEIESMTWQALLDAHNQRQADTKEARGSSRYLGVSWEAQHGKLAAKIKVDGCHVHLGLYSREEEEEAAAMAYDAAVYFVRGKWVVGGGCGLHAPHAWRWGGGPA